MHDALGDRIKRQYEDRTRFLLPRRTYTILRVDGKSFHTYTRQCEKPYDVRLVACMNATALALCGVQGCCFAYVQSDEISLLLGDFATIVTDAWFDGNVQKMVSVVASLATFAFNSAAPVNDLPTGALFDARVFTIPDAVEVENYFVWRQHDAVRNSIQGTAQAQFSHKQMHGLNVNELQELLFHERGINWNDLPVEQKRGRVIVRDEFNWRIDTDPPTFTADRDYLRRMFPVRAD